MVDDLIQIAKHQPLRIAEAVEEAFRRGSRARSDMPPAHKPLPPKLTTERVALAKRIRRKAQVIQEFDGRTAMLEIADELDPPFTEKGASSGPTSSSASNEGNGQP